MATEHVKLGETMAVGVTCSPPPLTEQVDVTASIEVGTVPAETNEDTEDAAD